MLETLRPLYDYVFEIDWYLGLVMGFAVGCAFYYFKWKHGK